MNSRSGFGSIIRKNKVLSYATRNIGRRFCAVTKHGKKVKKYGCRKTWIKSSKAMEPDVAVECLKDVIYSGLDPGTIAGDDDSASISKFRKEVKACLEKQCDYGHLKKNVFKKLEEIGSKRKQMLQKVLEHFKRCFTYALAQNKGNSKNVKAAVLSSIVPQSYGDHEKCGKWCGFIKSPSTYKHKYLLYGKDLTDPSLRKDLDKFFFQLAKCGEKLAFFG